MAGTKMLPGFRRKHSWIRTTTPEGVLTEVTQPAPLESYVRGDELKGNVFLLYQLSYTPIGGTWIRTKDTGIISPK